MRGKTDKENCDLVNFSLAVRFPDEQIRTLSGSRADNPSGEMVFSRSIGCKHDDAHIKMGAALTELSDPLLLASYVWKCDHRQALKLAEPFVARHDKDGLLARNIVGLIAIEQKKFLVAAQWYRDQIHETALDSRAENVSAAAISGKRLSKPEYADIRALYLYNLAVAKKRRAHRLAEQGDVVAADSEFRSVATIVELAEQTKTQTSEFHVVAGETFVEWSKLGDRMVFNDTGSAEELKLRRLKYMRAKLYQATNSFSRYTRLAERDGGALNHYPLIQLAHVHVKLAEVEQKIQTSTDEIGPHRDYVVDHIVAARTQAKKALQAQPLNQKNYSDYSDILGRICTSYRDADQKINCRIERLAALERSLLMDKNYSRSYRKLANIQAKIPGREADALANYERSVSAFYEKRKLLNTVALDNWARALNGMRMHQQSISVRKRILCERPDHRSCPSFRNSIIDQSMRKLRWNVDRVADFLICRRSSLSRQAQANLGPRPNEWTARCEPLRKFHPPRISHLANCIGCR